MPSELLSQMYGDRIAADQELGEPPLPWRPPEELPLPAWVDIGKWRHLGKPELINAVFRCTRCGMCLTTERCATMIKARRRGKGHHELYTPRGLISVIRALLEERVQIDELSPQAVEAASFCTACGRCSVPCIVNKAYHEGISPSPNIDHKQLFESYKLTLAEAGYDMGRRYRKMLAAVAGQPAADPPDEEGMEDEDL